MKLFILLKERVKQYAISNRTVFFTFCISSLLLSLLAIVMYGNTVTYMSNKKKNTLDFRTYRILTGDMKLHSVQESLQSILEPWEVQDIYLHYFHDSLDRSEIYFLDASEKNNVGLTMPAYQGRLYFTEEEILEKQKVVMVSNNLECRVGDLVTFGEYGPFEVIGIFVNWENLCVIPSTVFEDLNLPVSTADIILAERLDVWQDKKFVNAFLPYWGEDAVLRPSSMSGDVRFLKTELASHAMIYVVLAASLLFLLQYLTMRNRRFDAVCKMAGATKGDLALLLFAERILFALFMSLGGILLHAVFYDLLFQHLSLHDTRFDVRDYVIISSLMILAAVLASIPYVISYLRKPAARLAGE